MTVHWVAAATAVFAALLMLGMPLWTRPEIFFGVTVPAKFRRAPAGRAALRRYRLEAALHLGVALVLGASLARVQRAAAGLAALYFLGGAFHAFYRARAAVLAYAVAPTTQRTAPLPRPQTNFPGGWAAAAGPFALLALAARAAGRDGALAWPAVMMALVMGTIYGAVRYSRHIADEPAAERAEQRFRRAVLGLGLAAGYLLALLFGATWLHPAWVGRVAMTGDLAMAGWVAYLIRLGQGGSRVAAGEIAGRVVGDRTADRYWKAGLLYCNASDPAIFVEKRFGLGYTLNFGRPATWLLLLGLVALMAAGAALGPRHRLH